MIDPTVFPLLNLPRELRDKIYFATFKDEAFDVDKGIAGVATIGLLMSCEQVYEETIDLYYKNLVIQFHDLRKGMRVLTGLSPSRLEPSRLDIIKEIHYDTANSIVDLSDIEFRNWSGPESNTELCKLALFFELLDVKDVTLWPDVKWTALEEGKARDPRFLWRDGPFPLPRVIIGASCHRRTEPFPWWRFFID